MDSNTRFAAIRDGPTDHTALVAPMVHPTMEQVLPVGTTRSQGILQVILGIILVGFQIAAIVVLDGQNHIKHNHSDSCLEVGSGIWCGILVIVCGVLGCCSAAFKTNGIVIAFLVFNIFALILSMTILGMMSGELSSRDNIYCDHRWIGDRYEAYNCSPSYAALVGMTSVLLFAGIMAFSISIWSMVSSSIAIHKANACSCCRCCDKQPRTVYIYGPPPQHPTATEVSAPAMLENAISSQAMGGVMVQPSSSSSGGYLPPPPYAPNLPSPKAQEYGNPPYQQFR